MGGGVYCATSCNSIAIVLTMQVGGEQYSMIGSCTKALKVPCAPK